MSNTSILLPFVRAVINQICWHPETASKLAALHVRPSAAPTSRSMSEVTGSVAHYWRFGFPELWHSFLPAYLRGLLFEQAGLISGGEEELLGLTQRAWVGAMIDLVSTIILHPLHVAHLHYLTLPYAVATGTGFRSTRDAFVQLFRLGPANLFTGLPMAMINSLTLPFVRAAVNHVRLRIQSEPGTEQILKWIPFFEPLSVFLHTPTRVLSWQAMSQTPFLRPHVANFSYDPISHIGEVWQRYGISGFFTGLPLALLAATGRNMLWNWVVSPEGLNINRFSTVPRKMAIDGPMIFALAVSFFCADISPRLFYPAPVVVTSIHEETPTAHRSTHVY